MISSPTTRAPFLLYLACHTLLEAIFAGVALMKPLPASSAAWAYISLAFDAPVGVRLTNTSALVSSRPLEMLAGFALLPVIWLTVLVSGSWTSCRRRLEGHRSHNSVRKVCSCPVCVVLLSGSATEERRYRLALKV